MLLTKECLSLLSTVLEEAGFSKDHATYIIQAASEKDNKAAQEWAIKTIEGAKLRAAHGLDTIVI